MIQRRRQAWFSLVDETGSIGNTSLWITDAASFEQVLGASAIYRTRIRACSGAVFVRQSIVYRWFEPEPGTPAPSADKSSAGVFIFSCGPGAYCILELPGIKSELLQVEGAGAGLLLNQEDSRVSALIAAIVAGGYCNPFGAAITEIATAYLQIRR